MPVRAAYIFDATSPVRAEARFRTRHDRTKQGYFASHLLNSMGWFRDRTEVALQLWQTSHVGSPTNEWADVEATLFASAEEGSPVAVARCIPEYFSMRPVRPDRAWQRSARELAGRLVARRRRARSQHTVVKDEGHLTVGALDREVEVVIAQVRADRCCVADGRRMHVADVERRLRRAGCPHGCACRPTWSHYVFRCKHPELVSARKKLAETVGEGAEEAGLDGAQCGQMRKVLQALGAVRGAAASVAAEAAAEFMSETDLRREVAYVRQWVEPEIRGFVGGLIEGPGTIENIGRQRRRRRRGGW